MAKGLNLVGLRCDRWTVIARAPKRGVKVYWTCLCDCGSVSEIDTFSLTHRKTHSCGCYRRERLIDVKTKHGWSYSREYAIWAGIRQRCYNPKTIGFHNYGGRGIKMCAEWEHDFSAFLRDMGQRPGPAYSIDRYPSQDGDYEPGNCRWATDDEQATNTRDNRYLTLDGVTQTLSQWSRLTGLRHASIRERLDRGMSVAEALTTPPKPPARKIEFMGKSLTQEEWAIELGVAYSTIRARLRRFPPEQALDKSQIGRWR